MIIQLKNQAEFNTLMASLGVLYSVLDAMSEENTGAMLFVDGKDLLEIMEDSGVEPLTKEQVKAMAIRINSDIIICNTCENEFIAPFDTIHCPDCSKNQESKNA